ncbi:DUF4401 domain-containing protein [Billgrantia saliphila]|uniref:DUF4401 domain-containing protein n=1 Tax=Billgrantia saliphila TaxID=1848458 RepID=UPI000CE4CDDB|nr:DUF4401 domain-containing protein [Halomonas saliphila]
MKRASVSLKERLERDGVDVSEAGSSVQETPWFVRALQAISGWLAAVFLLGFIALGAMFVLESTSTAAALGLLMIGAAYAVLQMPPGDFKEHLALAASLAGQMLVAWALVDALGEASANFWWVLLGLQVALALVMPSLTHRAFSAFAASLALYLALAESVAAPDVASGMLLLALTAIWLNEFRWPLHLRAMQAWGYGLLLGLLAIQTMEHFGQSLLLGRYYPNDMLAWLGPWLGDALGTLALLLLLGHVFRRGERRVARSVQAITYVSAVVLMLVSLQAHGLSHGVVVVTLGFAIGNRLVMGLGALLLLLSIGSYYYWLDATLLTKALILFILGGLLLSLRWALRRWWRGIAPADESHGEGEGTQP